MSDYWQMTPETKAITTAWWADAARYSYRSTGFRRAMDYMQMKLIERWFPTMDDERRSRAVDTLLMLQERIEQYG